MRCFLERDQPRGSILICVNDCSSALYALKKGSNKPVMQAASEQLNSDCIEHGQFPIFLHVSGEALIADGHDDASRGKARTLRGPKCSSALWERAQKAASEVRWRMTVDMFASSSNAQLPRYMSWTDEPGSEQVDAFAARSWSSSLCERCNQRHTECGWYFPPSGIVDQCVRRALSDGAKGLFLVPTNLKAPYWLALRRVSKARIEIEADSSLYLNCERPLGRHTLFVADFSEGITDSSVTAPCPQAYDRRRKGRSFDRVETAEQEEIQVKLRSLPHDELACLPP